MRRHLHVHLREMLLQQLSCFPEFPGNASRLKSGEVTNATNKIVMYSSIFAHKYVYIEVRLD